jgi:aminoglycoside phosphotransferase (APT) family kinase protein
MLGRDGTPPPAMEMRDALLQYCQRSLPIRQPEISELTRISDGWENEVFSFTLTHEEDGARKSEDLILRVYPGDRATEKSSHEFDVLKRLHAAGFPVPRVLALEADYSPLGRPFVIMEKIEGQPLGPVIGRSAFDRKRALIERFCQMFVDLHALDWRTFVSDGSSYDAGDSVDRWLSRAKALAGDFLPGQLDAAFDWLTSKYVTIGEGRLALVHWDFHAQNVLLRSDDKAFVIDWTQAAVVDYRFDLGWTLLLAGIYDGWPMREAILHEYQRISRTAIESVEYFEVIACLRRLFSILVSLGCGAERLGMRPEAADKMRAQVSHIEGVYSIFTFRTGIAIPAVEQMLSRLATGS